MPLSAVVLLFALWSLTAALWRSAFVAALFALHPLHVESVAWIAERKDVLSGLFFSLTLLAQAWYVRRPGTARYALVACTFTLGLMCKPMLVTLPIVLLLLDGWPLGRWRETRWRWLVAEKLPLVAIAIAFALITFLTQSGARTVQLSPWIRIANGLVSYVRYVGQTFWPVNLSIFYPHPIDWPLGLVIASTSMLLLITALLILLRSRWPYLLVGWLWFGIMLVPVIGLVQVGGQAMADRYMYLPLIGLGLMAAWFIGDAARSMRAKRLATSAAVVVLVLCAFQSWIQAGYWMYNELLFTHALDVVGQNAMLRSQLATALRLHGKLDEAIEQDLINLRYNPNDADIHREVAIELSKAHRPALAQQYFERSLELDPRNVRTYVDLSRHFRSIGNTPAADESLAAAQAIDPQNPHLLLYLKQLGGS